MAFSPIERVNTNLIILACVFVMSNGMMNCTLKFSTPTAGRVLAQYQTPAGDWQKAEYYTAAVKGTNKMVCTIPLYSAGLVRLKSAP